MNTPGSFHREPAPSAPGPASPSEFDAFVALLGQRRLPLLTLAAQLPRYADASCDPAAALAQVAGWCEQLSARVAADASATNRLRLLNHFFFRQLGFAGAVDDYDSVENSYLHRVIARRRGIPITLSLLYAEIGRAAGLQLRGVSFPGRFLVSLRVGTASLFIDVFGGGATLSAGELRARLRKAMPQSPEAALAPFLNAADDREIIARMLRNLKRLHCGARQWPAALEVMNRLVTVLPEDATERRDRALVYEQLECPRAAVSDLVAYLSMSASPPDAADARDRLARLQQAAARLN
jgi:regulator of sirC expression with transglutaminase-like and TPR domain